MGAIHRVRLASAIPGGKYHTEAQRSQRCPRGRAGCIVAEG